MLELKNIVKIYPTGSEDVVALKGIDLRFRNCEFVSILGPSGCGKTTLLNIIGGLDRYTSGDLCINGRSTMEFKDRDWDAYRNHSIGFVFQSYNLIPHQTVLKNVELALTLSGVKKAERKRRAIEALELVGLGDQLKKKPSEMSGGQMQRVAIARAIVNDPDIILADEPTGALDTETSVQVMEILKEISSKRLVIMVTHNPDLALQYSTRIINMLDGQLKGDSMPVEDSEMEQIQEEDKEKTKIVKKLPSMSLLTSFGLSLKNLMSKKGRTILMAFAGSIGIIGIALIYAVSQGTSNYINAIQEESLSSYPLSVESTHTDLGSMLETFMGKAKSIEKHDNDAVYQKAMLYELMNSLSSLEEQKNDLKSFKKYIEDARNSTDEDNALKNALSGVLYTYDIALNVYTENVENEIIKSDTSELMSDLLKDVAALDFSSMSNFASASGSPMASSSGRMWQQLLPGEKGNPISDLVKKQYSLLYGSWPTNWNEVVVFVDEHNEISDLTLYALGLESKEEIENIMRLAMNKEEIKYEIKKWSYEEICGLDFKVILDCNSYRLNETDGTYFDLRSTPSGLKYLYDNADSLKVVGVAKLAEGSNSTMVSGTIGYTSMLTEHLIRGAENSPVVSAQKENPNLDVLTNLFFKSVLDNMSVTERADAFRSSVQSMTEAEKAKTYLDILSVPSQEQLDAMVDSYVSELTREDIETVMLESIGSEMALSVDAVKEYLSAMSDEELMTMFRKLVSERMADQYGEMIRTQMAGMTDQQLAMGLDYAISSYNDEICAFYYESFTEFSDSSYEANLRKFGCIDLDTPFSVNLYASTFADKDIIKDCIKEYNDSVEESSQIGYTDYVGILMSSITTIIDAITYVLIAFVAVSLVVSSIMIGVITLISVQERTKEIGILRAIGASKRNVSSMFNAETIMIGFAAGAVGVCVTWLLCIPINLILKALTDIENLKAVLPVGVAITLVVISMILTLIAGVIPSRSAAKKDPVVALRTD